MFDLIILKEDGSFYWSERFNDLLSAETWIATEQTRPYWDPTYTYSIADNTPPPAVLSYRELRAKEYPPAADYLDAIVKNDEVQKQAYIDACLAIKLKYPKPIES